MRKMLALAMIAIACTSMLWVLRFTSVQASGPRTWIVDDDGPADFSTIQEAINATSDGDTVYVKAGAYEGSVAINRTISLIGEDNMHVTICGTVNIDAVCALISNFTVQGGENGINLAHAERCIVTNNIITGSWAGILAYNSESTYNTISRNAIRDSKYGIGIGGYLNVENDIVENNISNCETGIFLSYTNSLRVRDNTISLNQHGLFGGVGIFSYFGGDHIFSGNVISKNGLGLYLDYDWRCKLTNNTMFENGENFGVGAWDNPQFFSSHDIDTTNTVDGKPIYYWVNKQNDIVPFGAGYVALICCENVAVRSQNLTSNREGLLLIDSENCTVAQNDIFSNFVGISITSSSNNSVLKNDVRLNAYGLYFYGSSESNVVTENTLSSNSGGGVTGTGSSNNQFFHNNFLDNSALGWGTNNWDYGYPLGGNYWSDYSGRDVFKGAYQNETGSDGIGDAPYTIDTNNQDNYPLISPYVSFENQTIYIRADGSVDPSGAPILRQGDSYTLTDNITCNTDGIVIERDNITLNGDNHALLGTGIGVGVRVPVRNGATINNLEVSGFEYGMFFSSSSYNSITDNMISRNGWGVFLYPDCTFNNLSRNSIADNSHVGFYIGEGPNAHVNDNVISENNVSRNPCGIYLAGSENNTITNNSIAACSSSGIRADWCLNHTVVGNNFTMNEVGISFCNSSNCYIFGNTVSYSSGVGVWFDSSSNNNSIIGNSVANNWNGIYLSSSSNISVDGNNVTASGNYGIWLYSSSNNTVSGNRIENNHDGLMLETSSNNTVTGNNVSGNHWYGIELWWASNNTFCQNNFVENFHQLTNQYTESNVWDEGYPSGGNHWSDGNKSDVYGGPYQNMMGSDGIGDSPYIIDANNKDNYPLMKPYPWGEHDIGITYFGRVYAFDVVVPLKTVVGLNYSLNVDTFVMNYGANSEVFNVTMYANESIIGTFENVTLAAGNSTILSSRWNTTGLAYGNYTIRAVASNLSGETDLTDNTRTDGTVYVGIPGDINGDGKVDVKDIAYVARRFGLGFRDSLWDPNADINDDGKIDVMDVAAASRQFGEHYP